ncbi:BON domain-containing protein [Actinoplanes rectilineatus]|uniref:BON domain-containing protein n=1 Tax=Actinoplanes rectilineatus TaxID=113571 RepID=UPI000697D297|nr:BON domain-containing protein [Actinoplanes rectilineatus]
MWPLPYDDGSWFDRRTDPANDPDLRLTGQVVERLLESPELRQERITVEAQNRVVTLTGSVTSPHVRATVAALVRDTPGVVDICNRLRLTRAAFDDVRPDPFDALVAGWATASEPLPVWSTRRKVIIILATLANVLAAGLALVLLPEHGVFGLFFVVPCVAVATVLAASVGRHP